MQANISWQGGDGADSKKVERASDGGSFITLTDTLPGDATSYEDTTITAGTHIYRVSAINVLGTVSSDATVGPPSAFTALTVTVVP
jgi:hypothetical protein